MIVLTPSTAVQTFRCIPRGNQIDPILELTDEQTNVTTQIAIQTMVFGDYVSVFTAFFTLVEGHFYNIVLLDGIDVVFKDRVFCTAQPLVTFSVNNNQYVSNTTTNEFIVYE
jgi:hypothetical protein